MFGPALNEFGYNEHLAVTVYRGFHLQRVRFQRAYDKRSIIASRWLTEMLKVRLPRKNLLKMYRFFCIFNSLPAGATCDCEKSEWKRWLLKICPKKKKKKKPEFSSEGVTQGKHKEGKVHFAWTYETCAISFTSCSTPFGPHWHYRVHSRVLTDITGYIYIGSYWDYRVHTLVLTDITGCTPDITGYTHWFLLTLQGESTSPHWHYRVYLWVLTDITGYTPGSLLMLQGTPTGFYWHYRVHQLVLADITGYTPGSLLTLQGAPLTDITGCTPGSLLTLQGAPMVLTNNPGYTHWSLLTSQGTPLGPYWRYKVHRLLTLQGAPLTDITGCTPGSVLTLQGAPMVPTNIAGYTNWSLLTLKGTLHGP